ncbi:MAG: hypothetical protein RL238_1849 [Actinomycetota bacterium]|jgi:hypothetical protein
MQLMPDPAFEAAIAEWSTPQQWRAREVRAAIAASGADLREWVNDGPWMTGYVYYGVGDDMVAAIGPTAKDSVSVHLMPFYGSPVLRERHAADLDPFVSGKSCLRFRPTDTFPAATVTGVVDATPAYLDVVAAFRAAREKKKR